MNATPIVTDYAAILDAIRHAIEDLRTRFREADEELRPKLGWIDGRIAALSSAIPLIESRARLETSDVPFEIASVRQRLAALAPARGHFEFATEAARALEDVLTAQARIVELAEAKA